MFRIKLEAPIYNDFVRTSRGKANMINTVIFLGNIRNIYHGRLSLTENKCCLLFDIQALIILQLSAIGSFLTTAITTTITRASRTRADNKIFLNSVSIEHPFEKLESPRAIALPFRRVTTNSKLIPPIRERGCSHASRRSSGMPSRLARYILTMAVLLFNFHSNRFAL
jgi:hypothetical protein